jgi:hypothetical protein
MNALAYIVVIAPMVTLMLSLILIAITLLFGRFRNSDRVNYLYFFSFSFLVTGIVLTLLLVLLLLIRAISFEQLQPIVTSYVEAILPTGSVTTTLIAAFLVRPYFRKTQITNNRLELIISQLQRKDINDKDHIISQNYYRGHVMQCALRVAPEHFAVPTVIKNAIGWVALINKKNMIQLHGTYSPWAYGFNYVVNIVGEESLILFFIICNNIICDNLPCDCDAESVKEALKSDGVTVAFPVAPSPQFAPSPQLRPWDGHLAVAFKVSDKERDNLWLHVRIGGLDAFTYDKKFRLIDLIEECVDSKNIQK